MNKVILVGNVSSKGTLATTKKDTAVINLSLATNERYKDEQGEKQQHTDFHDLTCYGKIAEIANEHVEIGATLCIEGHLNYGSYEKEGQTHKTTTVVVEKLEFHSAKKKTDGE